MPDQNATYQKQVEDRATRASAMKHTLLDPFRTDDGKFLSPKTKAEASAQQDVRHGGFAPCA